MNSFGFYIVGGGLILGGAVLLMMYGRWLRGLWQIESAEAATRRDDLKRCEYRDPYGRCVLEYGHTDMHLQRLG